MGEEFREAVTRLGKDAPKLKQFAERPWVVHHLWVAGHLYDSSQINFLTFLCLFWVARDYILYQVPLLTGSGECHTRDWRLERTKTPEDIFPIFFFFNHFCLCPWKKKKGSVYSVLLVPMQPFFCFNNSHQWLSFLGSGRLRDGNVSFSC